MSSSLHALSNFPTTSIIILLFGHFKLDVKAKRRKKKQKGLALGAIISVIKLIKGITYP